MSLDCLRVYKPLHKKVRLGRGNDGGYIICELDGGYDAFLSGGINNDISFEKDFLLKNPELTCEAFDGSIGALPEPHEKIKFHKKMLGNSNNAATSNLAEQLAGKSNVFMKMDIEGGEVSLFKSFSDADLLRIKQLVLELHSAHERVIPERLAKTHWLVHFHGNNCCGAQKLGAVWVPNVFELTYIRKDTTAALGLNDTPVPDPALDQPNLKNKAELSLKGYPYTA